MTVVREINNHKIQFNVRKEALIEVLVLDILLKKMEMKNVKRGNERIN